MARQQVRTSQITSKDIVYTQGRAEAPAEDSFWHELNAQHVPFTYGDEDVATSSFDTPPGLVEPPLGIRRDLVCIVPHQEPSGFRNPRGGVVARDWLGPGPDAESDGVSSPHTPPAVEARAVSVILPELNLEQSKLHVRRSTPKSKSISSNSETEVSFRSAHSESESHLATPDNASTRIRIGDVEELTLSPTDSSEPIFRPAGSEIEGQERPAREDLNEADYEGILADATYVSTLPSKSLQAVLPQYRLQSASHALNTGARSDGVKQNDLDLTSYLGDASLAGTNAGAFILLPFASFQEVSGRRSGGQHTWSADLPRKFDEPETTDEKKDARSGSFYSYDEYDSQLDSRKMEDGTELPLKRASASDVFPTKSAMNQLQFKSLDILMTPSFIASLDEYIELVQPGFVSVESTLDELHVQFAKTFSKVQPKSSSTPSPSAVKYPQYVSRHTKDSSWNVTCSSAQLELLQVVNVSSARRNGKPPRPSLQSVSSTVFRLAGLNIDIATEYPIPVSLPLPQPLPASLSHTQPTTQGVLTIQQLVMWCSILRQESSPPVLSSTISGRFSASSTQTPLGGMSTRGTQDQEDSFRFVPAQKLPNILPEEVLGSSDVVLAGQICGVTLCFSRHLLVERPKARIAIGSLATLPESQDVSPDMQRKDEEESEMKGASLISNDEQNRRDREQYTDSQITGLRVTVDDIELFSACDAPMLVVRMLEAWETAVRQLDILDISGGRPNTENDIAGESTVFRESKDEKDAAPGGPTSPLKKFRWQTVLGFALQHITHSRALDESKHGQRAFTETDQVRFLHWFSLRCLDHEITSFLDNIRGQGFARPAHSISKLSIVHELEDFDDLNYSLSRCAPLTIALRKLVVNLPGSLMRKLTFQLQRRGTAQATDFLKLLESDKEYIDDSAKFSMPLRKFALLAPQAAGVSPVTSALSPMLAPDHVSGLLKIQFDLVETNVELALIRLRAWIDPRVEEMNENSLKLNSMFIKGSLLRTPSAGGELDTRLGSEPVDRPSRMSVSVSQSEQADDKRETKDERDDRDGKSETVSRDPEGGNIRDLRKDVGHRFAGLPYLGVYVLGECEEFSVDLQPSIHGFVESIHAVSVPAQATRKTDPVKDVRRRPDQLVPRRPSEVVVLSQTSVPAPPQPFRATSEGASSVSRAKPASTGKGPQVIVDLHCQTSVTKLGINVAMPDAGALHVIATQISTAIGQYTNQVVPTPAIRRASVSLLQLPPFTPKRRESKPGRRPKKDKASDPDAKQPRETSSDRGHDSDILLDVSRNSVITYCNLQTTAVDLSLRGASLVGADAASDRTVKGIPSAIGLVRQPSLDSSKSGGKSSVKLVILTSVYMRNLTFNVTHALPSISSLGPSRPPSMMAVMHCEQNVVSLPLYSLEYVRFDVLINPWRRTAAIFSPVDDVRHPKSPAPPSVFSRAHWSCTMQLDAISVFINPLPTITVTYHLDKFWFRAGQGSKEITMTFSIGEAEEARKRRKRPPEGDEDVFEFEDEQKSKLGVQSHYHGVTLHYARKGRTKGKNKAKAKPPKTKGNTRDTLPMVADLRSHAQVHAHAQDDEESGMKKPDVLLVMDFKLPQVRGLISFQDVSRRRLRKSDHADLKDRGERKDSDHVSSSDSDSDSGVSSADSEHEQPRDIETKGDIPIRPARVKIVTGVIVVERMSNHINEEFLGRLLDIQSLLNTELSTMLDKLGIYSSSASSTAAPTTPTPVSPVPAVQESAFPPLLSSVVYQTPLSRYYRRRGPQKRSRRNQQQTLDNGWLVFDIAL